MKNKKIVDRHNKEANNKNTNEKTISGDHKQIIAGSIMLLIFACFAIASNVSLSEMNSKLIDVKLDISSANTKKSYYQSLILEKTNLNTVSYWAEKNGMIIMDSSQIEIIEKDVKTYAEEMEKEIITIKDRLYTSIDSIKENAAILFNDNIINLIPEL